MGCADAKLSSPRHPIRASEERKSEGEGLALTRFCTVQGVIWANSSGSKVASTRVPRNEFGERPQKRPRASKSRDPDLLKLKSQNRLKHGRSFLSDTCIWGQWTQMFQTFYRPPGLRGLRELISNCFWQSLREETEGKLQMTPVAGPSRIGLTSVFKDPETVFPVFLAPLFLALTAGYHAEKSTLFTDASVDPELSERLGAIGP